MNESQFDDWFAEQWKDTPGADEPENRDALRQIWNKTLERAAYVFQMYEYDDLTPDQVAAKLREMKEPKNEPDHL